MAQSVKLKDGSYIDTDGIYDVTQGKTQAECNNELSLFSPVTQMRFYQDSSQVGIIWEVSENTLYQLKFYTNATRVDLIKYDIPTKTYTNIWIRKWS